MKHIHRRHLSQGFTALPNALLQNKEMTFRARGLLCMMLSLPSDWQTNQNWLQTQAKEGREAINSAVKELEKAGYVKRQKIREKGRIIRWSWDWYDSPQYGKPSSGNPHVQKKEKKSSGTKKTVLHSIPYLAQPQDVTDKDPPANPPTLAQFKRFLKSLGLQHIQPESYQAFVDAKWHTWDRASSSFRLDNWRYQVSKLDTELILLNPPSDRLA